MAVNYSVSVRNDQLQAVEDNLLAGTGNPRLYLYTGAKPVSTAAADPSGLATTGGIDMGADPFNAPANGQMTLRVSVTGTVSPGGTGIQSFRLKDSDGVCHAQGTVGTSGADLNLQTVNYADGMSVVIESLTVTAGNG